MNGHINKTLILFTESFPYGFAEQFLETEILYLAARFGDITIVPLNTDGSLRKIPKSIKIEKSLSDYLKPKYSSVMKQTIFHLFYAVQNGLFYKEILGRPKAIYNLADMKSIVDVLSRAIRIRSWFLSYFSTSNLLIDESLFYTYWFNEVTMGLILAKEAIPNLKVVSRIHGYDLYTERRKTNYIPFRNYNIHRIDNLFPISHHGWEYVINKYNFEPNKIYVSRLGVDNPKFNASSSKEGEIHIVSCSFLVPVKRVSLILKGIRTLAEMRPELKIYWNHLGGGPLLKQLELEAIHDLPSRINFRFHGSMEHENILNYYKENPVDVFINVSESEGIPVSIMEAQSFGIPAIATSVGGTPEIVNDNNGFLLKENPRPKEIAEALNKFSNKDPVILKKRLYSKMNWNSRYNAKLNYNDFSDRLLKV